MDSSWHHALVATICAILINHVAGQNMPSFEAPASSMGPAAPWMLIDPASQQQAPNAPQPQLMAPPPPPPPPMGAPMMIMPNFDGQQQQLGDQWVSETVI